MSRTGEFLEGREKPKADLDATILGFACWVPFVAFAVVMGFAGVAALKVGHWPFYGNPDPKDLKLPVLHIAALLAYPVGFASLFACLLVVVVCYASLRRRDVVVYGIGAVCWAFMMPLSRSMFEWLID